MTAVFKREFKSYFTSMTGYAYAAFLLIFTGIYTMSICLMGYYTNYEYVIGNVAFVFLIIVPVLTMKVFAEERRQKTDQLLYALPLSMTKIVMGKYLALLAVSAVPMVIMAIYPFILSMFGNVSIKVSLCTMLGFFLLGASLIAIGMFISSLTESLPLAAGLTFLVMLINYLADGLAAYMPVGGSILSALCLFIKLDQFVYGVLDLGAVAMYLSVSGVFIFLTVQALEKRRWS